MPSLTQPQFPFAPFIRLHHHTFDAAMPRLTTSTTVDYACGEDYDLADGITVTIKAGTVGNVHGPKATLVLGPGDVQVGGMTVHTVNIQGNVTLGATPASAPAQRIREQAARVEREAAARQAQANALKRKLEEEEKRKADAARFRENIERQASEALSGVSKLDRAECRAKLAKKGKGFEPSLPAVLIAGQTASGKSTSTNALLGAAVQATGKGSTTPEWCTAGTMTTLSQRRVQVSNLGFVCGCHFTSLC
jgi:hypothetical protein